MTIPTLHSFGRDYLRLVLEIHTHHIDGYVDAYYGPPELKAEIEAAPARSPAALLADVVDLQARIPTADPARHVWLTSTLRAIDCVVRTLNGEQFDYLDEVNRLYDIHPTMVDEALFEAAHRELDGLLPAGPDGSDLAARLQVWRKPFEIETDKALPLLELARAETRRRTTGIVELPNDGGVEITLVKDQRWSAYNWYLGNGRSLIEFNTDLPLSATSLLATFAHEGYPGHHTEHMLKEQVLYRQKGYAEQAATLLHAPSAVIAEGIATTALEMIFPDDSHHEWNVEVMLPAAGIPTESGLAERLARIAHATHALRYVAANAATLYHTGQLDRESTIDYIRTYALATPARAAKTFDFISPSQDRAYIFTYSAGYDLITSSADPAATFRQLLTGQMLPSALVSAG